MRLVSGDPQARFSAVKSPQDLVAGLFFLVIGIGALWIARDYPVGSPQRMGTGAFPRLLCWAMILIGGGIALQSFFTSGERLTRWAMRPFVFIILAIFAFAFLLEAVGLVVATLVLLLVAAAGTPETRWTEAILFSVFMTALGVAMFVWGLGLPLRVWPI